MGVEFQIKNKNLKKVKNKFMLNKTESHSNPIK